MGLNPKRAIDNMPVPPDSIVIIGQFVNMDEGTAFAVTLSDPVWASLC
jgi:hypothetical protein